MKDFNIIIMHILQVLTKGNQIYQYLSLAHFLTIENILFHYQFIDINLGIGYTYAQQAILMNFFFVIVVFKMYLFYVWLCWVFVAVCGLFSSCGERGLLFAAVRRLLIAVASLVAEHGLQVRGLQQLWHVGSVVVARRPQSAGSVVVVHGLSCSAACGIFPDQGLNLCPLHWQADS